MQRRQHGGGPHLRPQAQHLIDSLAWDRLVCRLQDTGKAPVMRRQQLTEAQITALLDPPTDQRELVRHYTLSAADLAAIRRCRGDHNRLGHTLIGEP